MKRFSFVMDNGIVRKTSEDGLHIVRIARVDIIADGSQVV